jgi:hypothetical protein
MRAFTLSPETSAALDRLLSDPPEREVLSRLLQAPSTVDLDKHFLSTQDYEYLYTLLPPVTPGADMKSIKRWPTLNGFDTHLSRCSEFDRFLTKRVLLQMNQRIRINKRSVKTPSINVSRIVDALLLPAINKLYERARQSEAAPSKRTDAKEGRNKLSVSSRRKGVAV